MARRTKAGMTSQRAQPDLVSREEALLSLQQATARYGLPTVKVRRPEVRAALERLDAQTKARN